MLSTNDLAEHALPYIRNAVKLAQNDIKSELKRWEWIAIYPAWAVITGPLLKPLTRIGMEISLALTRAKGLPLIEGISKFAETVSSEYMPQKTKDLVKDFRDLYANQNQLHPAVAQTIAGTNCGAEDCRAGIPS